ncbi:ORF1b [Air potato virus 1]|uniref:ORF1b n=1 Tax=Air potato virus 1 TaxID=2491018 RepID=A0A3G6V9C2_9CLOS|nr:ORF1b [Air potato virus 1]AZB50207.1 ORF1b [Air potato virus 1]
MKSHLEVVNVMFDHYQINGLPFSMKWVEDLFQFSDFSTVVDNVTITECQKTPKAYKIKSLVPLVNSLRPSPRPQSLISNLYVFETRNYNADRGVQNYYRPPVVKELVDTFFSTYIDAGRMCEMIGDIRVVNSVSLEEWLDSRPAMGKSGLLNDLTKDPYYQDSLNHFKYMIKSDLKSKLDYTARENLASGQNIVYHERRICALFSSVFQDLVRVLKFVLADKFLLYHGVNLDEFAQAMTNKMTFPLASCYCGEVDISKYDKSQNQMTKEVELEIYRRLGMHPDLVDLWACSDFSSRVGSMKEGILLDIGAQRRTGTATTWIGNTLINMTLLAAAGDVKNFDIAAFSGDDSLLLSRERIELDSFVYEYHFGFDVKFYGQATPYFCSKFLIPVNGRVVFVPDALKLFVNLGAEWDCDKNEMFEKFKSFVDLTKDLVDNSVVEILAVYIEEKYGSNPWVFPSLCCINSLRSNFAQFMRCWRLCQKLLLKDRELGDVAEDIDEGG